MEAQPLRRQNWWIAVDSFFSVRSCQGLKTYWWPNLDMLCSNGIGGLEHLCFLLFMTALLPHSACTCLLPEIITADRMASHLALEVFAFFWGLSPSCQRCHKKKKLWPPCSYLPGRSPTKGGSAILCESLWAHMSVLLMSSDETQ